MNQTTAGYVCADLCFWWIELDLGFIAIGYQPRLEHRFTDMREIKHIHQSWSLRDLAYRIVDTCGIVSGLYLAIVVESEAMAELHVVACLAAVIIYYLMSELTGMYRNWRGVSLERELFCAIVTWTATVPTMLAVSVMTKYALWVDRSLVLIWTLATMIIVAFARIALRIIHCYLRVHGWNTKGFAIVGVTDLGIDLADKIQKSAEMGLRLVGFYDDREDYRLPDIPDAHGRKIGSIDQLVEDARDGRVSMIYITFPMRAEERINEVLSALGDTTASVYIVPDFFVFELLHSRWTNIGGLPAVSVFENPFYGAGGIAKRMFDVALASMILAAVSLPMVVISILVKFSSPGPIFFRQKRYGLDGREILVWKFRSMKVQENGASVKQATKNDPRTTKLGAFLRRTSLDELPQLFNVLEGSMSLVGPRPHANVHNEEYRSLIQGYMLRHKVKPGITGLAQVSGWRGETDTLEKMEKRVECDHRYIREWSLFMDLKILFRTVFVVFSRQNAY
ncbi:MAG: undecaprenyl-phosphate glucose phosphotransferase [Planctomycetales bacterium]|nr:undecaprenyl-phosphate glucose phosphotransferase [Planctomycetales bacterium]